VRQDHGVALTPQPLDRSDVFSVSGGCALGCRKHHAGTPWAKMETP
jgi:hypothetical protein